MVESEEKTIARLHAALLRIGVRKDSILLDSTSKIEKDDSYVLRRDGNIWEVYYVERGEKCRTGRFEYINDAANYLFWLAYGRNTFSSFTRDIL